MSINDNMTYEFSLFWIDPNTSNEVLLGDHFTEEDAKEEIKDWCQECETPSARDPNNYIIRRLTE